MPIGAMGSHLRIVRGTGARFGGSGRGSVTRQGHNRRNLPNSVHHERRR